MAQAATLVATPSSSAVTVGNILSVKISVATQGKAINNAESVIQFPADLLEAVSISKGSSIFSLWVDEPKFSNAAGTIEFNGGVPSPGFVGEQGEVLSIVFRAKKAGTASVVFGDSAVRQNDGLGTDILTFKQPVSFQIQGTQQIEVPTVPNLADNTPAKPVVTSTTHPQSDSWYANTTATFSWVIPSGVSSVQTLLGTSPQSTPTITYDSSVTQRTVSNLSDGVLYFHIRYKNSNGWGDTAHYKIQVDSTDPETFTPVVQNQGVRSVVTLNAIDRLSGVDAYNIQIDDLQSIRVKADTLTDHTYTLPVLSQEEHTLIVTAYDKAGNKRDARVAYVGQAIKAPSVEVYPDKITKGESVTVRGKTSYPHTKAVIFMQSEGKDVVIYTAMTADDGTFTVSPETINSSGLTTVWSQLVFSDTVKSPISEKTFLKVSDTGLVRTTSVLSYILSVIIPVLALIIVLGFILYMAWHKFFGLKRKVRRDMQNTAEDIHNAMVLLKEELAAQLEILERTKADRALNKKEEKIFKALQDNVDKVDIFINKKLSKLR